MTLPRIRLRALMIAVAAVAVVLGVGIDRERHRRRQRYLRFAAVHTSAEMGWEVVARRIEDDLADRRARLERAEAELVEAEAGLEEMEREAAEPARPRAFAPEEVKLLEEAVVSLEHGERATGAASGIRGSFGDLSGARLRRQREQVRYHQRSVSGLDQGIAQAERHSAECRAKAADHARKKREYLSRRW
jgi:hypothetical protein